MDKEIICKILEISVNAPSGSNSQPWKFEVNKNVLTIIALPEKDHPILNYRYRGTWIAHGALIENIKIAATHFCFETQIKIFPIAHNQKITAEITFIENRVASDPLFEAIPQRTTNRKIFDENQLTPNQKNQLENNLENFKDTHLLIVENETDKKILAEASSVNEIIMFDNKLMHKFFFEEIAWNKSEEDEKQGGLYLPTMELKLKEQKAFRLVRKWPLMYLMNKLGLGKMIARSNAKKYAKCAAMGAVIAKDTDSGFIEAGEMLERVWLNAISLKLNLHLVTGILFLHQNILGKNANIFSQKQCLLIENAYQKIAETLKVKNGLIALIFRIGASEIPTAKSIKKKPDIIFR